jgi:hypothetical protein
MSQQRLNARIDDELAAKLESIRNLTKQSTTEVVREALEHYHRMLTQKPALAYQLLGESGFIGCGEAEPELSVQYKAALTESLADKT